MIPPPPRMMREGLYGSVDQAPPQSQSRQSTMLPGAHVERQLDALRTRVANQAASLAETVTDGFDGFHMGAGDYVVELMTPAGPSTGGGWQARQTIRLNPRRPGYAVVVVGSVEPVTSTGEVRTFDHVAMVHELRFRRPLEITALEYAGFVAKLDVVLTLSRVRAVRVPPPPALVQQHRGLGAAARTARRVAVGASVVAAVFFALVVLRLFHGV